eukprot:TRINITY_DN29478_c0_g1_i1.p1 TRINITY_DN29478_c0_g1~~TRINITY_DN29478_c0_g1_i1.p1  ORF type:complete len:413 (+),score=116.81 TRINITY_DN29478_c0_g1_i1:65-1240(+)
MGCGSSASKKYSPEAGGTSNPAGTAVEGTVKTVETPTAEVATTKPEPSATEDASKSVDTTATAEATPAAKAEANSESEDEDDEMDDEEFAMKAVKSMGKGTRKGICAEKTEKDESWTPPVFLKTAEQEQRLRDAIAKCFMFSALDEEQLKVVIAAFKETPAASGATVIEQGAMVGNSEPALYVFETGRLNVFKKGIENAVFTYTIPGQYFGDLALLYSVPRAATVVAEVDSLLWSIDRETFNNLVKDAAQQQMQKRLEFLASVPVFAGLTDDERMKLGEAVQVRRVQAGDTIITQGEQGEEFFVLEAGKAEARIEGLPVLSYKDGDFFGELALLKSAPRAADVIATDACKLLVLGSEVFKRLLGPLDAILKERSDVYASVDLEALRASADL